MFKRFHVTAANGTYMGWTEAKSKEAALEDFEEGSTLFFPKPWRVTTNGRPVKWQGSPHQ